jgi:hypothetical protein
MITRNDVLRLFTIASIGIAAALLTQQPTALRAEESTTYKCKGGTYLSDCITQTGSTSSAVCDSGDCKTCDWSIFTCHPEGYVSDANATLHEN